MIKITLNKEDKNRILDFIGVQDIEDTREIVNKYELKSIAESYEESLEELYGILNKEKELIFNEKDANKIAEFIGVQDLDDTRNIVDRYQLEESVESYDQSLQELYDLLSSELGL